MEMNRHLVRMLLPSVVWDQCEFLICTLCILHSEDGPRHPGGLRSSVKQHVAQCMLVTDARSKPIQYISEQILSSYVGLKFK